ncbi:SHOCT domain-containing protein [Aquimarina macrocephali]|uniref:SHOCT domain-containing protein n=1 Tax=Aquimarina macrocephali TaxID=666563 RepID=UPI003F679184
MKYITTLFLLISLFSYSQNSYTTKSGFEYKVGDTITLGSPMHISSSPFIASTCKWETVFSKKKGENCRNMNFTSKDAIIYEIDLSKPVKIHFKIFSRKFYTTIEKGISSGEIIIPGTEKEKPKADKYDLIAKLKSLLDDGAITKEEYESEKKKILSN